ncbi:hypothetical protein N7466_010136 [Penicillium verhagenii]|uniref:uncharacterized protein n=1 Tax=Penicillium verhagenii TaxID=1562060 RepID=UPI0025453D26|nr:uncharacterized protein N7466_010136 [Penicillium verhagenii]KAJ5919193.1 hypothetical protein N7466_010136 [Penicillium verhagenii]
MSADFMTSTVIIQHSSSQIAGQYQAEDFQTSVGNWKVEELLSLVRKPGDLPIPEGLYLLCNGSELHQAWRLYPDHLDAFTTTVIPSPKFPGRYDVLEARAGDGSWRPVAVPSRLYSKPNETYPLAGRRLPIKDNFRLAWVKTTQ